MNQHDVDELDRGSLRFLKLIKKHYGSESSVEATRLLKRVLGDEWAGRVVFNILSDKYDIGEHIVLVKAPNVTQKINAIKSLRGATGMGLKESKDAIEAIMHGYHGVTHKYPIKPYRADDSFAMIEQYVQELNNLGVECHLD